MGLTEDCTEKEKTESFMVLKQLCLEDLPAFQRSLIVGYLLSDGYLRREGSIQFENSLHQADLIHWLWCHLEEYRTPKHPSTVERTDSRTQKTTFSRRFYTRSCFKPLYPLFYPHGHKTIPESLQTFLDAPALAVLYMGDGQLDPDGKCYVTAAHSWTKGDLQVLQKSLSTNFGLQTEFHKNGVNRKGEDVFKVYLPAAYKPTFFEFISPLVRQIPSMRRKLPHPFL